MSKSEKRFLLGLAVGAVLISIGFIQGCNVKLTQYTVQPNVTTEPTNEQ